MSAVATISQAVQQNRSVLGGLLDQVRSMADVGDLHEVRARAEAVKAWAKVHGHVRDVRMDLLKVEVEALVRIVQLGGVDTLPSKDRRAAEWLAQMTADERASLIAKSGSATTATGMCRSVWNEDELAQRRTAMREAGIALADLPDRMTEGELRDARTRVADVAAVLNDLIDQYGSDSEEFTTEDMADALIEEAAIGDHASDPTLRQGVSEVCRRAIRRAPVFQVGDTILPRFITARTSEGHIRIPVESAQVAHLADMIAMRREQLHQDRLALERLELVASRLRDIPGCTDESRIGALVAESLTPGAKRAVAS